MKFLGVLYVADLFNGDEKVKFFLLGLGVKQKTDEPLDFRAEYWPTISLGVVEIRFSKSLR